MDFAPLLTRPLHPAIAAAARHCHEISAGLELPRKQDFRPTLLRDYIGYLFVVNVIAGEHDYYYSLGGAHMALLYGADLTNNRLSEVDPQVSKSFFETYDAVVASRSFLYVRGRCNWPDRSVEVERLLVPMTGKDGTLDTIIGLAVPNVPTDMLMLYTGIGTAVLSIEERLIGPSAD